MLRGVNRYIIEISDFENEYFDKVLLFVNPDHSHLSYNDIKREGDRTVKLLSTVKPPSTKQKMSNVAVIRTVIAMIVGIAIGLVIKKLFSIL